MSRLTQEPIKVNGDNSEIGNLLKEYEPIIEQIRQQLRTPGEQKGEIVVLTGTTGSLGIHLLEALLSNATIRHVYCLNRRANAAELHEAKTIGWKSQLPAQSNRVTFLQAGLDQPNLGLEEKEYEALCSTATIIIHNAWTVNFMLPLKAYRSQLDGLVNLFRLAASRSDPPKLQYISSISSVMQLMRVSSASSIPEEVVHNFNAAAHDVGYAKSKLVAELLCDAAAQKLNIPVSFVRVGQIAGAVGEGVNAVWNMTEWLPSLVITSISLGVLPDRLGAEFDQMDWVPVDLVSRVLVELGVGPSSPAARTAIVAVDTPQGAEVFNLLNPNKASWKALVPAVVSSVKKYAGRDITLVTAEEWLEKLEEIMDTFSGDDVADLVREYPALRLQEFYERILLNDEKTIVWDLGGATSRSDTLNSMSAVGQEWVESWVEGWVRELQESAK